MGLSVSHGCFRAPYSTFGEWRNHLAVLGGYRLALSDFGFYYPEVGATQDSYAGEWEVTPKDALLILLAHSDCEGVIHHEHIPYLVARLEELYPMTQGYFRGITDQFIVGLRMAHDLAEDVQFS